MPSLFDNPDATGNTQDLDIKELSRGKAVEAWRSREGSFDEPSAEPSSEKEGLADRQQC